MAADLLSDWYPPRPAIVSAATQVGKHCVVSLSSLLLHVFELR